MISITQKVIMHKNCVLQDWIRLQANIAHLLLAVLRAVEESQYVVQDRDTARSS